MLIGFRSEIARVRADGYAAVIRRFYAVAAAAHAVVRGGKGLYQHPAEHKLPIVNLAQLRRFRNKSVFGKILKHGGGCVNRNVIVLQKYFKPFYMVGVLVGDKNSGKGFRLNFAGF